MITFQDKVAINENPDISNINKITASDMNSIKAGINANETNINNNYTNLGGKIIWTNNAPSSNFSAQTIILNESLENYDFYEIHFLSEIGTNEYLSSGKIKVGYASNVFQGWCSTNTGISGRSRSWQYTSNTQLHFDAAIKNQTTAISNCIPLYVIAYKTGIFD